MTIKVTHRGTPPSEVLYSVTCPSCSSKMTFNIGDTTRKGDQRDGNYYILSCPVCTKEISMSSLTKAKTEDTSIPSARYFGWELDR